MPTFPASVYPVSTFRSRLRSRLRDDAIDDPANTGHPLPTVFTDAALNESIREGLSYVSVYRRLLKPLTGLSFVAGQSSYNLPDDFVAPDPDSWDRILGPSNVDRGDYPGSRYGQERLQNLMDSPNAFKGWGNQYGGYQAIWGGGAFAYPYSPAQFDTNGQIVPGSPAQSSVEILPPTATNPNYQLVFSPAPTASSSQPLADMYYLARYPVLRLAVSGGSWATNTDGSLTTALVYNSDEYVDSTDILGLSPNDDAVRLVMLYATYWTIQSKIMEQSESDGETYAFYARRSGMTRKDMDKLANDSLKECERRTRRRALAMRA